jgi:prepilin-type N-terminal cleavage/methylation domain-containing protein
MNSSSPIGESDTSRFMTKQPHAFLMWQKQAAGEMQHPDCRPPTPPLGPDAIESSHHRCDPAAPSRLTAAFGTRRSVAFTLVELLTVIAVIAVLASLLMTAVASAKKKSRTAVCTFNLHQISLALEMYLDDFGKRPPGVDDIVSGKYLPTPRSLLCPEDKTGNWGRLVQSGNMISSVAQVGGAPPALDEPLKYSYLLHPLSWDDLTWDRLMRAGGSAGVAACQLHGLGTQDIPDVHSFSGLLLRAQRDGAVVRRRLFWSTEALPTGTASAVGTITTSFGPAGSVSISYPYQIYLDDPTRWFPDNP